MVKRSKFTDKNKKAFLNFTLSFIFPLFQFSLSMKFAMEIKGGLKARKSYDINHNPVVSLQKLNKDNNDHISFSKMYQVSNKETSLYKEK